MGRLVMKLSPWQPWGKRRVEGSRDWRWSLDPGQVPILWWQVWEGHRASLSHEAFGEWW